MKRDWELDLMVTHDDAGTLHWRGECCELGPTREHCYRFFDHHTAGMLYPPWNDLYAKRGRDK